MASVLKPSPCPALAALKMATAFFFLQRTEYLSIDLALFLLVPQQQAGQAIVPLSSTRPWVSHHDFHRPARYFFLFPASHVHFLVPAPAPTLVLHIRC